MKMPFAGTMHRAVPMLAFQPPLSLHRTVARFPIRQRPRVAPTVLPILQPPAFCKESDFIYEGGDEQLHIETQDQLPIVNTNSHTKKIIPPAAVRCPAFAPQHHFAKQPVSRLMARAHRRAVPKYPPHFFCMR